AAGATVGRHLRRQSLRTALGTSLQCTHHGTARRDALRSGGPDLLPRAPLVVGGLRRHGHRRPRRRPDLRRYARLHRTSHTTGGHRRRARLLSTAAQHRAIDWIGRRWGDPRAFHRRWRLAARASGFPHRPQHRRRVDGGHGGDELPTSGRLVDGHHLGGHHRNDGRERRTRCEWTGTPRRAGLTPSNLVKRRSVNVYVVTLQCQDRPGIVLATSTAIVGVGGNILENDQFTDPVTSQFCMRTRFETDADDLDAVRDRLVVALAAFTPDLSIRHEDTRRRALVMVSQYDHCLAELLYRRDSGDLPLDIVAVVSNHPNCAELAARHGVPFYEVPVTPATKTSAENE